MTEKQQDGLRIFSELRGAERAAEMEARMESDSFGAALIQHATDYVFSSVWGREGLDRKQRSLVTIGILIGLRQTDELRNHVEIGVTNGLSAREIEEAILQSAAYAGFPAAWSALRAATEVLQRLGLVVVSEAASTKGEKETNV
ncbi:carboxymuconolactone decarboxylase [Granulicella sp. WH15]|uniref:carboxymuconolactone decarboxylase family protein n=1 Tax=Granulicella sp. WH15 TaxID=2602070 RepID=UPI001366FDF8|nr:carboxymuconolactone decarboxylase family protein [Granulicella sp. WH15]QHN03653.1 carboxymuconolactone decarboxylase [Granulicella sp. WH15]